MQKAFRSPGFRAVFYMDELKVRKRHRLREKEAKHIADEFMRALGATPVRDGDVLELAATDLGEIIISGGEAIACYFEGKPFPTVRGLLRMSTDRLALTVDMGA